MCMSGILSASRSGTMLPISAARLTRSTIFVPGVAVDVFAAGVGDDAALPGERYPDPADRPPHQRSCRSGLALWATGIGAQQGVASGPGPSNRGPWAGCCD